MNFQPWFTPGMLLYLIPLLLGLHDTSLSGPADAQANVDAASMVATAELPVEVLLAVAYQETRFLATSVSRVHGAMFCGPLQAMAHGSTRRCHELADLRTGYAAGAAEITRWLVVTHGNLAEALAHHACGNTLGRRCWAYAGRVLRTAHKLELAPTS